MTATRGDDPATTGFPRILPATAAQLPVWPVAAMFVWYPIWWALGLVDIMWIPLAVVMVLYLGRAGLVRAPRGFGMWLLFLAWSACSFIGIKGGGDAIGFVYRFAIYVAATAFFVYVYNARETLTIRFVSGVLTVWWLTTVVGGYLGLVIPGAVLRTPLSFVLSDSLLSNQLVRQMVIRKFAQFNADSYFGYAPRPSAPFLYTNNWGNIYSLLLPFVFVYLFEVKGERRFKWLALALVASVVPATLTLNRGMFLGIGVSVVYVALRLALQRDLRGMGALAGLALVGVVAFNVLPIQERLESRLSGDVNSNTARSSLYEQAFALVPGSPLFGYGGPQASAGEQAPVGTQGQFWMLLVSHGPFATALFVGFFLYAFWRVRKRRDAMGVACGTVLLVGTMELFYYGVVPNGLPLMMVAAAMALREDGIRQ